jgi:acetylornithine deacetylase ArgE
LTTVDIAKELIKFDTSGPPTKEKPLAKWIKDYLEDLGVNAQIQDVAPDRANVIAKIGEGKGPGVVLSGHIDVVLAGDLQLWKETAPYDPKVTNGKLYGRGACDMKGPDACILQAVTDNIKNNFKKQLTLVFTSGEDTGGWFVEKVIADKLVTTTDARFGVIPEPSVMRIVRAHKGSGGCVVAFKGKAAHSSRPEWGINAIIHASDFIKGVKKLQKKLDLDNYPLLGHSTVKPTLIIGGLKSNIIPPSCEVTINARLIPGQDNAATFKGWMDDIINSMKKQDSTVEAEIRGLTASVALDVPENSEVVKLLMNLLGTKPEGEPYYTEAVSYSKAGIPTVICGPGDIAQAHTQDEFITLEQLSRGTIMFNEIIKKTCL